MKRLYLALLACLLCLVWSHAAFGAGFAIYEWSARGNALVGTTVARGDDASTISTNPAGLSQLEGTQTLVGLTAIQPTQTVSSAYGTKAGKENTWLVPHLYGSQQMNQKLWLGLGAYTRFGLGTQFGNTWFGRYNNIDTSIESISAVPTMAYKVSDAFSLAAGVEIMEFSFSKEQAVTNMDYFTSGQDPTEYRNPANDPATDIRSKIEGDSTGLGANFGVLITPSEMLRIGFMYRTPVTQDLEGDASFTKPAGFDSLPLPGGPTNTGADYFNNTSAKGTITLPDSASFGIAFFPAERLSVELDAVYTWWEKYRELSIEFGQAPIPADPSSKVSTSKKDWRNTWRMQLGVEYGVTSIFDVRCGYVYDESPIPGRTADYLLPAWHRHIVGLGLGFHPGNLTVDVAYNYLLIKDRSIPGRPSDGVFDSDFKDGDAQMYSLSLGYKF
jgi:long-chain fatty acid transport protein